MPTCQLLTDEKKMLFTLSCLDSVNFSGLNSYGSVTCLEFVIYLREDITKYGNSSSHSKLPIKCYIMPFIIISLHSNKNILSSIFKRYSISDNTNKVIERLQIEIFLAYHNVKCESKSPSTVLY